MTKCKAKTITNYDGMQIARSMISLLDPTRGHGTGGGRLVTDTRDKDRPRVPEQMLDVIF